MLVMSANSKIKKALTFIDFSDRISLKDVGK